MKLPIATNRTVGAKILELFSAHKGEFLLVIATQIAVAVAAVVTPWIIGRSFDALAGGAEAAVIRTYVAVIAASVLVNVVANWFADFRSRVLGQKVFHELRVQLVEAVMHLPLSTVEAAGTGDLLGRTTSDINRVEFIIRQGVSRIMVLTFQVIVTVVAAFLVEWRVGFVVVLSFVPMYFVVRKYLRRTIAVYLAASALNAEVSGDITETVEQSATVDSLAMSEVRVSRTSVLLREYWDNERYSSLMRALLVVSLLAVLYAPMVISILWGAWLVGLGYVTVGAVISVTLYAQQLRVPLDELAWWFDELQFAAVALARIFGVAEVAPDRTAGDDAPASAAVSVEGVSFSYRDGHPVLRDVSLEVSPGERLAIVGPSGAGKSTLGRLIAAVNPPDAGSIRVGGVEVTSLPEALLHRTIALVTQENHVFVGTIADNLRFAKEDATDDELLAALATVDATWVERLDNGLETLVGSGERELAPSQAQQLALARIVLLDPDVLILDEATSLLDPTVARSAERALVRLLEGRTVISIAHRLYTAYDADRVAVMIDGEVAELGSHDDLVALGGEYASLWEAWQQD
ncbi:ABC transporter ATP-binding protein [Trueperella abortisuis]|uniref:ABC-type multidrug transport system fused ATPase/permease subunit n=1 Tax=Trueperella abortisuis TaxID=445930 RepID=A0ABT9PIJ2_9ACTO|nr:ABC transporter ATP-binding protein [Trueperella abortisuis]MDP9831785.1 ABC-type multidrug transport system fused ATPase/permease subunit [Trueperella abortisuis]